MAQFFADDAERAWYQEANKRGLLSGDEKAWFDEAMRREGVGGQKETPVVPQQEPQQSSQQEQPKAAPKYDLDLEQSDMQDIPDISAPVNATAEAMSNIPKDAIDTGSELVGAMLHPIDTVTNVGKTALGYGQKGVRALTGSDERGSYENYADAMNKYISDRYGSLDNLLETYKKHPVGMASDIAALATGLGGMAKGGAKVAALTGAKGAGNALAKTGEVASKVGAAFDPLTPLSYAMKPITAPISSGAKSFYKTFMSPEALYQSALKPHKMPEKDMKRAIAAGLDEGITISDKGTEKAAGKVREYGKDMDAIINDPLLSSNTHVPSLDMAQRAAAEVYPMFGGQAAPTKDMKAISEVLNDFYNTHPDRMYLPDLQQMKQGTYQSLNKKAWSERQGAGPETEKALARAARDAIEQIGGPQVREINRKQGGLLELQPLLDDALRRSGNWERLRSMAGPTGLYGMLGHSIGGTPGAIIGGLLGAIASQPSVKSKTAILERNMEKAIGSKNGKATRKAISDTARARRATAWAGRDKED